MGYRPQMKRGIWILLFLLLISVVNAQVDLTVEGDKIPSGENSVKVMIDDAGWFGWTKKYIDSTLRVEIVGPARFSDGTKTKEKNLGDFSKTTKAFEDTLQINEGHSEEKGRVIVIATFEYNLKKGIFNPVIEVDRTQKSDVDAIPVEGFKIVKDVADYEALSNQNKKLESEKNNLDNQIIGLNTEIEDKNEIIEEQNGTITQLQEENTKLKIKVIINYIVYVGLGLLFLLFVIFLFLYLSERRKHHHLRRQHQHH